VRSSKTKAGRRTGDAPPGWRGSAWPWPKRTDDALRGYARATITRSAADDAPDVGARHSTDERGERGPADPREGRASRVERAVVEQHDGCAGIRWPCPRDNNG
jgi:hypothetical protein